MRPLSDLAGRDGARGFRRSDNHILNGLSFVPSNGDVGTEQGSLEYRRSYSRSSRWCKLAKVVFKIAAGSFGSRVERVSDRKVQTKDGPSVKSTLICSVANLPQCHGSGVPQLCQLCGDSGEVELEQYLSRL